MIEKATQIKNRALGEAAKNKSKDLVPLGDTLTRTLSTVRVNRKDFDGYQVALINCKKLLLNILFLGGAERPPGR